MADHDDARIAVRPPAMYMNFMSVRSNLGEIFFDFGQTIVGGPPLANIVASLVTSPQHAKMMLKALADNLERYEARHGVIELPPQRQ
mgnify:CR=1 FL=1